MKSLGREEPRKQAPCPSPKSLPCNENPCIPISLEGYCYAEVCYIAATHSGGEFEPRVADKSVLAGRKAYVRVRIPEDVQHAFGGRTEVWRSLGTSDERAAKRLGVQKLAELQNDWQRIRIHAPAPETIPPRDLTENDISRHAAALYESELRLDERRRENLPTDADLDRLRTAHQLATDPAARFDLSTDLMVAREAAGHDRTTRTRLLAELRRHLGSGETSLITWAADAALARDNLKAGPASPMYRRLCQALTRAWIEAIERTLERDKGVFTGRPADPIVIAPPALPEPQAAAPGEDILKLYDEYQERNPNGVKPDTLAYGRTSVRLFVESLPKGTGVNGIDKAAVRGWLALMRQYPVKAGDFLPFRGLNIRQVIEANKTHGKPVIITRTINKAVTSLSSFCVWLDKQGYIDGNPAKGFHEKEGKTGRKIRSYTDAELKLFFTSPIFTGYKSDAREYEPGTMRCDDWRFWLPYMALYTGGRLGELAHLLVADVRQESGVWCLDITEDGEGEKSLKTAGSHRLVPIHPELIRLGLLDYHARQLAAGSQRLFPEIEADTRGFYSGRPSRWFRSYSAAIGLKAADKTINFHSFRHGVADALRRAGYMDHEFGFLLGHASQATKITRGYGSISEGDLNKRNGIISAISFAEISSLNLTRNVCKA